MPDILLKIVVNEQQHEKRDATCKKILTYLWDQGVPGATMKRGEAGLDYQGTMNYDLLEDTYFMKKYSNCFKSTRRSGPRSRKRSPVTAATASFTAGISSLQASICRW